MAESYEILIARIRLHIQKANFMGLKEHEGTLLLNEAADAIEELSKTGTWVKRHDDVCYWYECSECGEKPLRSIWTDERVKTPYCAYCGARMIEAEVEQ